MGFHDGSSRESMQRDLVPGFVGGTVSEEIGCRMRPVKVLIHLELVELK